MNKFRAISFWAILSIALLGLDNSAVSFQLDNTSYLEEELDLLWKEHDFAGKKVFLDRVNQRLPELEDLFKEAANSSDLHWTLLAAISYQESHWNPRAISKTGVRGLMMLTQTTAKEVGISRRTDPRQSVIGGSIYFQRLLNRFPESVPRQDRLWMAIAAYNLGFSYLTEARHLTKKMNKDPNSWEEIKESLLLLTQHKEDQFTDLRINEALDYVRKIQLYYQTLSIINRASEFEIS